MSLDVFDEIEFISRMNLDQLTQNKNKWNFRCPFCGDSKKNKYKKRGWLCRDRKYGRERITYSCFNCNIPSMELRNFIKRLDDHLYQEYLAKERASDVKDLMNGNLIRRKEKKAPNRIDTKAEQELKLFVLNPRSFKAARNFPDVVSYCRKRKFPESAIDDLLYCDLKNNKVPWREMLIFPLRKGEKVYGFQGRSIKTKRFHNFMHNDNFKVYGIFEANLLETVYCFESIIDSYSVPNSIAMLGASLSDKVLKKLRDVVFVFDNDPTGLRRALKYAQDGHKVFIWPNNLKEKDFNDLLVKKGLIPELAKAFVDKHTAQGLEAVVKLELRVH